MRRFMSVVVLIIFPAPIVVGGDQDIGRSWLLVTTPALRDAFEPLAAFRRAEGYDVRVIDEWTSNNQTDDVQVIIEQLRKAREAGRPTYVLIGGSHLPADRTAYVPTTKGIHGRMKDQPTDYYYSLPDVRGIPMVTVGRLPARNSGEAIAMVRKTIKTENEEPTQQTPHLSLIVANPGGETRIEKQFGEVFLQTTIADRLTKFDPNMRVEVVADIQNSQFTKSGQDFGQLATSALTSGSIFTVYCGHSSADGLWSESRYVVSREVFASFKTKHFAGVFLSCGCFTCQIDGPKPDVRDKQPNGRTEQFTVASQGFGIAAIRNPDGPSAVIGPYGESYAAFGKLAMDALFQRALAKDQPTRVGGYWNSVQNGLVQGKMDPIMFFLFDQADGSRGKATLAKQRPEHVEMWTLLGDPAMKLPPLPN